MRVPDRDDELADPKRLGIAELGRFELAASVRRTARSESASVPTISTSHSRPSANDAMLPRAERWTTCAEVSMKPSGVITTAEPPPSSVLPPRTRRATRRFATDEASRSATPVTTRE